jgi:hypothetical protein
MKFIDDLIKHRNERGFEEPLILKGKTLKMVVRESKCIMAKNLLKRQTITIISSQTS